MNADNDHSNDPPVMETKRADRFPFTLFSVATLLLLLACCGLSLFTRNWQPFVGCSVLLLAGNLVLGSATSIRAWRSKHTSPDAFIGFHVSVVAVAAIFLLVGIVGMIERPLWFQLDSIPDVLVSKSYPKVYSNNDHRQFKRVCDRINHGPVEIREISGRIYARCGLILPETFTISAPMEQFGRASRETENDPPVTPVFFESATDNPASADPFARVKNGVLGQSLALEAGSDEVRVPIFLDGISRPVHAVAKLDPVLVRANLQISDSETNESLGFGVDGEDGRVGIRIKCSRWTQRENTAYCKHGTANEGDRVAIVLTNRAKSGVQNSTDRSSQR